MSSRRIKNSLNNYEINENEDTLLEKDKETTEPPKLTKVQGIILVITLCMINLFANSAYSSIAPFYPGEAVGKGVPASVLGLIFSSYSVSMAIFAPLFAKLLYTQGAKKVLILGCVSEGVAMVVFGLFDFIEDPTGYAVCSFLCRFLEGFGNGCLNSGSSKMLMTMFPSGKLAKLTGLLQTFTGLGMLMGPIMGSVLFKLGGF